MMKPPKPRDVQRPAVEIEALSERSIARQIEGSRPAPDAEAGAVRRATQSFGDRDGDLRSPKPRT